MTSLSIAQAERFAEMALSALGREYPSKILHTLSGDTDVRPPRDLTPAFFGAYDWHSAVHGHWSLVRLLRAFPRATFEVHARQAISRSLTPANIAAELDYARGEGRSGFEVPYGMGWLLTLDLELCEWNDADARAWRDILSPLARLAAERIERYAEKLPYPVRTGEHTQTAFGLGLYLDWSRGTDSDASKMARRILDLYSEDRDAALHLEPSGYDFLSPSLAEADLMRRVLDRGDFAGWLDRFLPGLGSAATPGPVTCPDPSDAKLAHLDGLNLSRAWMLHGMAGGLPPEDARRSILSSASVRHAEAGLRSVTGQHYAGSHWQGTFAVYLATERGQQARSQTGMP